MVSSIASSFLLIVDSGNIASVSMIPNAWLSKMRFSAALTVTSRKSNGGERYR